MSDYPADASYERGYDHGHAVGFREAGIKFEVVLAASDKRVRELEDKIRAFFAEHDSDGSAESLMQAEHDLRRALSHTKEGEG